jgi:GTPase
VSDTVGFISDLPTMLVAAFRATLEEVIEADLILHVRDVSHGDTEAQSRDVETVLAGLGVAAEDARLVEVWNKIDLVDAAERERLENLAARQPPERRAVLVSAVTGEGVERLNDLIEARLGQSRVVIELDLDPADGAGASWLHRNAEVLERTMNEEGRLILTVRADPAKAEIIRGRFLAPAPEHLA